MMKYDAKAIGSGSEAAQAELQDKFHKVRSSLVFLQFTADTLVLATANDPP